VTITESLATMNADGSRHWINPRPSAGKYASRRRGVAYGLIALFVTLPFLRIGGQPVLLFDLARQQLHVAGATFYSDDVVFLTLLLLSAFIGVFWITAVVGRAWCGWACPQTVYLEWVFRPIERALKKRPKILKYGVYVVLSIALSHVFLGYFVRIEELARWITESPAAHPGAFGLVMGVSGLIFFDFAYFREQMCVVICPYARLQSALLDKKSLVIAYDPKRGEPRAKLKILGQGDCIDCRACVTTCPTGIDIRDGLQLECIACAQCADACDAIMTKVSRAPGLIRYATQEQIEGTPPRRGVRPRLIVYPVLLVLFGSALAFNLGTREEAEVIMLRKSGVPFVVTSDGNVVNALRIRIRNRAAEDRDYRLTSPDVTLTLSAPVVHVPRGGLVTVDAIVEAPRAAFAAGEPRYSVEITDAADPTRFSKTKSDRMLGPSRSP